MDAILIRNLSKSFKLYHDKPQTLKEKVLRIKKSTHKSLDILKDINLTIKEGEMVALIGHNGSGKSTLLKLLTKIIYPNQGYIDINGRVSSLLELGAGFHPDFTGMENIFMNASIFGLTKKEIQLKLEEIISFSELGEFIYNPVRTYSSGMYMRLAFAVAINIEPDILLVDEVLAVGDASFQRKCLNRIKELKKSGKTIVLVTHDHGIVERMCDRAIWLHDGIVMKDGKPKDVVNHYLRLLAERDQINERNNDDGREFQDKEIDNSEQSKTESKSWGNKIIEVTKLDVISDDVSNHFYSEGGMTIRIHYNKNNFMERKVVFGVAFHTLDKIRVYGTNTLLESVKTDNLPLKGCLEIHFPTINLIEGDYDIDIALHDENGEMFEYIAEAARIRVLSEVHDIGLCRIPHTWNFKEANEVE